MNAIKVISDNIAWDGSSFFCRRCGKAGYGSMAKVKGHLSMCAGRAIQLGAIRTPAGASQALVTVSDKGLGNFSGVQATASPGPSYEQLAQLANVNDRLSRLENEYNHVLVANNTSSSDWLSSNKAILLVVGAVVLVALLLRENKSSNCGMSEKKGSTIAQTLLAKGAGKFLDKSIDKVFSL